MKNIFLQAMVRLALAGGKVSLQMMQNSKPCLKPDNSVLTRADLAVSKLVRNGLRNFLKSPDHLLIDEEDKNSGAFFSNPELQTKTYIWVADPIDGTRNYSNRIPFYGVSIGLLKDLKPWLGVVYLPVLDELFYCDGQNAYFVQAATSKRPKRVRIKRMDQRITRQSVFFGSDGFFKTFHWDFELCQIMLPSCAVVDLCFPAIGRGAGCFFNASLWDLAGAWPIARCAGLELREISTGRVLDRVRPADFIAQGPKAWKVKDYYLLSSRRNFKVIRNAINPLR